MPIELIGLLEGKDVLVGAIDVATDRVETPEEVAAAIRAALRLRARRALYPCTNCGMVPLSPDVARGKLAALAAGRAPSSGPRSPAGRARRPRPAVTIECPINARYGPTATGTDPTLHECNTLTQRPPVCRLLASDRV